MKFEHLSVEDGLSQSTIYSIMEDKNGFMWFGTRAGGLNKYNGYTFTSYKTDHDNPYSISGNEIISLYEDYLGVIWVGTRNDGLNRFDPENEQFHHCNFNLSDSTSISDNTINCFYEDDDKRLWIGTNNGLYQYDREENNFIQTILKGNLKNENIKIISKADNGLMWIGCKKGLFLYDQNACKQIANYKSDKTNPNSLSDTNVTGLIIGPKGRLWVGTRYGGLNCLVDSKNGIFRRFQNNLNDINSITSDVIRTLNLDTKGNIWVGTKNALEQLTPDQQESANPIFIHHEHIEGVENSLSRNSIFSFFEDSHGSIWVGNYSKGVNYLYTGKQKFEHYKHNIFDSNSLNNNMVSSFAMNDAGLWIGTEGGGLNLMDRNTGNFKKFRMDLKDPYGLTSDHLKTLLIDKDNDLWVGTYNGIHLYDREKNRFYHYLGESNIYTIEEGIEDEIWIGTSQELIKLDKETKNIETFRNSTSDSLSLSTSSVNVIYKDKHNRIWIGTKSGLNLYNRESNNFMQFMHDKSNRNSVSDPNITSIGEDMEGDIWVGTFDGLNKFDVEKNTFTRFGQKHGLPNDYINNIEVDNNGFLWVTSNGGLSKINPKTSIDSILNDGSSNAFVIRNFSKDDGLQGLEFIQNSSYKNEKGEIFLGGMNGFNVFYPDSLKYNTIKPKVYITEFKLFNKIVDPSSKNSPLTKPIWQTKELTLTHKQFVINFGFVALNYTSPQKNQFAYFMEGIDTEWNYIGNKRDAAYTNLKKGTYLFKVKASNNDGVWNEEATTLKITILPPWWGTLWFKVLVFLMIIGLIVGFYFYKLSSLKKQKDILEEKVKIRTFELEKAEQKLLKSNDEILKQNNKLNIQSDELKLQKKELEETISSKDKLFSIIAHDIKNPFVSILGFLELLNSKFNIYTDERKNEMINIAYQSGKQVFSLIENLLQWARSQRGLMPFNLDNLDLKYLIDSELELANAMISKKEIGLKLNYNKNEIDVYADQYMLSIVIRNLLTNAIKFTPIKGNIVIDVSDDVNNATLFKISDTGIGIPDHLIDKLFGLDLKGTRSGTSDEKGSGLGLLLCKEFVEKHRGKIWLESKEGIGTTFYFTIPHQQG